MYEHYVPQKYTKSYKYSWYYKLCNVCSCIVFGKEIVTYEAIVKIEAQVDRPRPLLLIGEGRGVRGGRVRG